MRIGRPTAKLPHNEVIISTAKSIGLQQRFAKYLLDLMMELRPGEGQKLSILAFWNRWTPLKFYGRKMA